MALKKTTPSDRGLIELPVLTPHLEFRLIGDGRVLLVSETFNTLLHGQIQCDLLPLLDGRRTRRDIAAALAAAHSVSDVEAAITALASRGYVVSGDHGMAPGRAAYWSSLGASPRWAEQRLEAAAVAVDDETDLLVRRLAALGVRTAAVDPALAVLVCDDYLDERYDAVNRRHIDSGTPWMLVRPGGVQPLFGPVFRPAEGGPCWACLAYRLRGHREVHNFVRNFAGHASAVRPRAAEPAVMEAVCGLAAAEIARWLVLEDMAPIHERAISLDVAGLESGLHPAMRRPQCPVCGDDALYRSDRPAEPVRLRPSPKRVRNSGGHRSVPPEETLAGYRHLVSPITGVVTWLKRTTDETDPWLHVYWAGNNLALKTRKLSSLRRSLRSKSAGKGSTPGQSEASALCEAVERYSGAFHGDEIRCRKRFADFEKAGESEAIPPNDVQLFSDRQLDDAERINARGHPYNFVPDRLDAETEIDWSPVWSLTEERHRYLPTSILYGRAEEQGDGPAFKADSNGCAAGNTLEEAILQGFYELVERDAFAIWWYNRLRLPAVDLGSFGDEYLTAAPEYYRGRRREIWVLDATGDFGIPVFVAISRRTDKEAEDIIYGAGAHTDPHVAALRALCELNQCLQWVEGPARRGTGRAVQDPVTLRWWRTVRLEDHSWLAPAPGAARRRRSDYPVADTTDTREDVERCRALVEARGMEFLVLDQTRPDIGMPVARVIVPGMRHFWERFAPGRLFEVPVSMGWRESPVSEEQLNPIPVIA
jgi:ribosomal protein S12 methylthiotransferase accessory factor